MTLRLVLGGKEKPTFSIRDAGLEFKSNLLLDYYLDRFTVYFNKI